ncbi:Bug family tripartite tricarboxylate transporter substrate binding protein [Paracandidimonas soli]|uniref:Tripartite-type tricarboxylate transporter receptor subunit TctC n=1 Tax=Paracandidimonas soli TaxID=1917182 RepID=A0A4R3VGI1_9BURK|nr:tripartite tricarboxylate transporter substrate binding protein [Paracandidimonas soli]TCV03133.1 tripartite-type tricarboxylate transporter receptor subunit TctC [Paracandidimonas soli]
MLKNIAAVFALALSFTASAQDYPNRPITLVVPFAPGGTVDLMGRIISERLSVHLGQPVIVSNRAGAGGTIGTGVVAKAPADGYTLLVGTQGQVLQPLLYKKLNFDSNKDLLTAATFASVPNVLAVSMNTPAATMSEFVEYARSNPGAINMGSAGIGSINHLVGEIFQDRANVKLTHIPYKGAAPAMTDLQAGEVHALFVNLPNVMSHVAAGKVRLLGIASDKRSPAIPDVPTFAEGGVQDTVLDSWYGVMAPVATPQAVVKKIQDAVLAMTQEQDFAASLIAQGAIPFARNAAESAKIMEDDLKLWAPVVERLNIQMD